MGVDVGGDTTYILRSLGQRTSTADVRVFLKIPPCRSLSARILSIKDIQYKSAYLKTPALYRVWSKQTRPVGVGEGWGRGTEVVTLVSGELRSDSPQGCVLFATYSDALQKTLGVNSLVDPLFPHFSTQGRVWLKLECPLFRRKTIPAEF